MAQGCKHCGRNFGRGFERFCNICGGKLADDVCLGCHKGKEHGGYAGTSAYDTKKLASKASVLTRRQATKMQ